MAAPLILCIDAGFRSTGLVIGVPRVASPYLDVVAHRTIKTVKAPKKRNLYVMDDDVRCATEITEGIRDFIRQYAEDEIKLVAVELPTGGARGARANRTMGIATGLIVATLLDYPTQWIQPRDNKKNLCGTASASKKQMTEAIRALHPDVDWPDTVDGMEHEADACALAYSVHSTPMFQLLARS